MFDIARQSGRFQEFDIIRAIDRDGLRLLKALGKMSWRTTASDLEELGITL
jgi:hypothetical protein